MKVGVLLLHTQQGWSAVATGDIAVVKAQYKQIKTVGCATVADQPADLAVLLTTSGEVSRKKLDDPASAAARERLAAAEAVREKLAAQAKTDATTAQLTAKASAAAVAAVTQVVAEAAGVAAEAVAEPTPVPAAPPPPDTVPPTEADDSPAAHFGGKRKR